MKPQYQERYERASFLDTDSFTGWVSLDEDDGEASIWFPPGGQMYDPRTDEFGAWTDLHFPTSRTCAYCRQRLLVATLDSVGIYAEPESYPDSLISKNSFGIDPIYRLWNCQMCGFWQWFAIEFHRSGADTIVATPISRTFESALPMGCSRELAQHFARTPDRLTHLSPRALEHFVVDVFRANHAHSEVTHVGRPGDGGVDILFIEDGEREWLVQVKRRSKVNQCEGVEVVRNLLGTMMLEGKTCGIVVSTASHFSHFAHDAARRAMAHSAGIVHEIKLIDRVLLASILGRLVPRDGWLKPLQEGDVCQGGDRPSLEAYFLHQVRYASDHARTAEEHVHVAKQLVLPV